MTRRIILVTLRPCVQQRSHARSCCFSVFPVQNNASRMCQLQLSEHNVAPNVSSNLASMQMTSHVVGQRNAPVEIRFRANLGESF